MKALQVKDLQRGYYWTITDDYYYIVPDSPNASGYTRIKCWHWCNASWVDRSASNPHPQNMSAFGGKLAEILGKGAKALSPCADGEAFNWPMKESNPATKGVIKKNAYSEISCQAMNLYHKDYAEIFLRKGYKYKYHDDLLVHMPDGFDELWSKIYRASKAYPHMSFMDFLDRVLPEADED